MAAEMGATAQAATLHAGCVLLGESGVLIRGPSGAGKSTLALALIGASEAKGRFARLVSDDRTRIQARGGRLLAMPVPAIAGLVERRGLGLTPAPHEAAAVIRLIVDCLGQMPERMPEPEDLVAELSGVTLPRLPVQGRAEEAALVLAALELFESGQNDTL